MSVAPKNQWRATASSGDPSLAIDDFYATSWVSEPSICAWLSIDLGQISMLGGIEIYWGKESADVYRLETSVDNHTWAPLCSTRHGQGGQNIFAFPPTAARFLRLTDSENSLERALEIVEVNVYSPEDAVSVREKDFISALGHSPVTLLPGESITVDFGYVRSPLGALIEWGENHGTVFSVALSDDGEHFREVGRITTSSGGYDDFYWRTTTSRYFRLTIDAANVPEGAVIKELKLRILNKDRMPIGQLERAALAGSGELYPQALLGRQVFWTALGEPNYGRQAIFDEYGNLEAQPGLGQLCALIRHGGRLHGAPGAETINQTLADGSLPIPSVIWRSSDLEIQVTALAYLGQVFVEYRITNTGATRHDGALVLAVRPVQINPYWQHGGHAVINAIDITGREIRVNDNPYAVVSQVPQTVTVTEFADGDVVNLISAGAVETTRCLRSSSGLLSAAVEFDFCLGAGESSAWVSASPLSNDVVIPDAGLTFDSIKAEVIRLWREKMGPRRISVGDREVSDTVAAQTALILVNATPFAFKPGPRNYDRTWIRDGSSQALALLWAGLTEDAMRYVLWYAERIYPNGMVPPILNPDGSINRGYGSDIEFDAQGEFVTIAADIYRITRDRDFLSAVFEPVVRATGFLDELCARTNAIHGPETRFYGLLAPSISHEGYNKPTYSYWDNFFALSAWRNCEFLAREIGDEEAADRARIKGEAFAATLARSMRMTAEWQGSGLVPASADRGDIDPTSLAIAFEPCRVSDVLPADLLQATYDDYAHHLESLRAPDFKGGFTPYELRNLNALIALGRIDEATRMVRDALSWQRPHAWHHWAEVVYGDPRAPDYIGDMPHTWIGAEFATSVRRMLVRENGTMLELLRAVPDEWWLGDGITLTALPTSFGTLDLRAQRSGTSILIDLCLTGPQPETVTVRYPGVLAAVADGVACDVSNGLISCPPFKRLQLTVPAQV